jgi:chromate transporter
VAAYVGFGLPAFLFMLALSAGYKEARDLHTVASIFRGLQVIVVALVANATLNFGKTTLKGWQDGLLAAVAAACLWAGGSPILVVIGAAALGLVLYRGGTPDAKAAVQAQPQVPGQRGAGTRTAAFLAAAALGGLGVLYFADRKLFALAALMMKVDLFAFGGGFGSLPILLHEVVEVRHWLDARTFLDGIALGQVTPGPILITATFVGYKVANFLGAAMATLGMFAPSFFILVLLIPYHDRLQGVEKVKMMEHGVLSAFIGMLAVVLYNLGRTSLVDIPSILIAVGAFLALYKEIGLPFILLAGGILSMIIWGGLM